MQDAFGIAREGISKAKADGLRLIRSAYGPSAADKAVEAGNEAVKTARQAVKARQARRRTLTIAAAGGTGAATAAGGTAYEINRRKRSA